MKKFVVSIPFTAYDDYIVEAENEQEAILKVAEGDGIHNDVSGVESDVDSNNWVVTEY